MYLTYGNPQIFEAVFQRNYKKIIKNKVFNIFCQIQFYSPQVSQLNGLSPEWILAWFCKVDNSLKHLPHSLQE